MFDKVIEGVGLTNLDIRSKCNMANKVIDLALVQVLLLLLRHTGRCSHIIFKFNLKV